MCIISPRLALIASERSRRFKLGEGCIFKEGGLVHPLVGHDGPIGGIKSEKDHGQEDSRGSFHVRRVLMTLCAFGLQDVAIAIASAHKP